MFNLGNSYLTQRCVA